MMSHVVVFLLLMIASTVSRADAVVSSLLLYLPDQEMSKRVEVESFAEYVANVANLVEMHFKSIDANAGVALVVARRGNDVRIWTNVVEGDSVMLELEDLAGKIEDAKGPRFRGGIVPFALGVRVGNSEFQLSELPMVPAWRKYFDGKTEITVVIGKAWDD